MLKPFRYRICLCNSRPGRRVQRTAGGFYQKGGAPSTARGSFVRAFIRVEQVQRTFAPVE